MPAIKIRIDRDQTNALYSKKESLAWTRGQYAGAEKFSIVAEFVTPVSMFRIVDEREVAAILRTGFVTGGAFSTPGERKHGASWAGSTEGLAAWGKGWQRRKGFAHGRLGPNLYLLELPNAAGKTFFHLAPVISPPFDPFGPPEQIVSIDLSECSTGLGCSISKVRASEIYFYRVLLSGKTIPVEMEDLRARTAKKIALGKSVDLTAVNPGIYYTGWIHGHSVIVVLDQTRRDKWGLQLTRLWDVIVRDGNIETPLVVGKKTRKAAIEEAASRLSVRPIL